MDKPNYKIKVLLVDDQELLLDLMNHLLESDSDIEVIACAKDGNEAIELANKLKPDVILMDIKMPNCDGIEATKKIKEADKNNKILILTTSKDEEDVHLALNNGADGYVLKSINENELVLAIKSVYANMEVIHNEVREMAKRSSSKEIYTTTKGKRVMVNDIQVELSNRELEIIKMIVEGRKTSDIAADLFISEGRLRNVITTIISKLMVDDRTQLAVFALKSNLI